MHLMANVHLIQKQYKYEDNTKCWIEEVTEE